MDLKKGMDRIALVLAIVVFILCFLNGIKYYKEESKIESIKYKKWPKDEDIWNKRYKKAYNAEAKRRLLKNPQLRNYKKSLNHDKNKFNKLTLMDLIDPSSSHPFMFDFIYDIPCPQSPPQWVFPPFWQQIIAGVIAGFLGFVGIMIIIGGTTRIILWIGDGFRGD